jgi:tetratricopeptide (TPR) repeat protein
MSNAAKLKKKAIELEQKKQFDKALTMYIQFFQESDGSLDDVDIPLYNRVGDLLLRTGNASDALSYYEKAVDLYAERGFHNNAIALCNKVLRQSPGRTSIYYKLGKISATKGFKSDAKRNFLEYADRMQKAGRIDEAFRALKEFADLCPDQDDIRLMLAEQLSKENRQGEALEQLQKLHEKLDSEGRTAEARATAERMKAIDPDAIPRASGSYRAQKSSDLIFLDTSFDQQPGRSKRQPTPAPPPGRPMSDPDLIALTLADQPDGPVSPAHNAAVSDAFGLAVVPNDASEVDLPLLDVDELPSASELMAGVEVSEAVTPSAAAAVTPLDLEVTSQVPEPAAVETLDLDVSVTAQDATDVDTTIPALDIEHASSYVAGPPLTVDYAGDLAADLTVPLATDGDGLFDFRAPPRSEADLIDEPSPVNLDPDVAFPSFDLDDMSLPSADEVTSGGSVTAALGDETETLGTDLDALIIEAASAPTSAEPSEFATTSALDASQELELQSFEAPPPDARTSGTSEVVASIDDLVMAEPDAPNPAGEVAAVRPARVTTAPAAIPAVVALTPSASAPVADAPRVEEPAERLAGWESQRAHAERLLEAGDRAGGVQLLEQVASELERIGDLERALTIVDELIRLSPDSIRHHQKRVEYAFRASDRAKLIDAYLELGDALFRFGEEKKARAVYHRVLELAPEDPRAHAALESVSSMSPPSGSGAIPAIPATPQPSASRSTSRDAHVSATGNGARSPAAIGAPPQSRKPSPLERSYADGEFVDLGEWLRSGENPKSTRMVTEEKPPTGDEQADFQEMLKRFKQGVAENVDDEDFESHYDLGVAYKEMGLMDEAVAEFQKALRGSTKRVRAYEALGQCFVEKNQYHVAASVLGRAIALGEGDDHHLVGVLYLLGRATEALSRHREALDYYQRVFAVDIEFRDVAERIHAIERKGT